MAEERLIDDDKDRKYKIRKNADGEDELIIDETPEEEPEEEMAFEMPEFEADDEEAAIMTPEQLAARMKAREEEEAVRLERLAFLLSEAKGCLAKDDYAGTLDALSAAEELDDKCGEVYAVKLVAISKRFTDLSLIDECVAAADGVSKYAADEQKRELSSFSAPLVKAIDETKEDIKSLGEENEAKKSERRVVFAERRKKSLIRFIETAAPFAVFLVLAIVFSTLMFSRKDDSTFIVLTIVFGVLAVICFILSLITAHKLWECARNVKLNERNSSTKIGREYEAKLALSEKLDRIYASFKDVL